MYGCRPYITIAPPPQPALGVDVPPYTSRTVRSFVLDPANRNHVIKLLQVFQVRRCAQRARRTAREHSEQQPRAPSVP